MTSKAVQVKIRENRARRAAERQGLWISKTRRRDRLAPDYGLWFVYDEVTGKLVLRSGLTIAQLERWLKKGRTR